MLCSQYVSDVGLFLPPFKWTFLREAFLTLSIGYRSAKFGKLMPKFLLKRFSGLVHLRAISCMLGLLGTSIMVLCLGKEKSLLSLSIISHNWGSWEMYVFWLTCGFLSLYSVPGERKHPSSCLNDLAGRNGRCGCLKP